MTRGLAIRLVDGLMIPCWSISWICLSTSGRYANGIRSAANSFTRESGFSSISCSTNVHNPVFSVNRSWYLFNIVSNCFSCYTLYTYFAHLFQVHAFNWHFSQDLQNLSISRLILGQTKDNLIPSLVFSSPRCPPNGSSCANDITLILLSLGNTT